MASAALISVLPATAKEGVVATLTTAIPLDAPAGTPLDVGWTLDFVDEDGQRRSFGGGGIFVRLISASGASAETAFAREESGDFTATVLVPKGGIRDVEIGIRGWSSGPTGTRRSDALFPITNDPVPGVARVASPASGQSASERLGAGSTWIFFLVAGSLSTLAVLAVVLLVRRRNASSGVPRTDRRAQPRTSRRASTRG